MIYFNGRPLAAGKSVILADLLRLAGREASLAVVTVDGKFVPPADYKRYVVPCGARVRAGELQNGG